MPFAVHVLPQQSRVGAQTVAEGAKLFWLAGIGGDDVDVQPDEFAVVFQGDEPHRTVLGKGVAGGLALEAELFEGPLHGGQLAPW